MAALAVASALGVVVLALRQMREPATHSSGVHGPRAVVSSDVELAPFADSRQVERVELGGAEASQGSTEAAVPALAREPSAAWVGRVVDTSGVPLAGVRVLAAPQSSERMGLLDSLAWDEPWIESERLSTSTDAKGRFRVASLPAGFARLALRAEGHATKDVERLFVPAREGEQSLGDFELEPLAPLAVSVVGPTGEAIAGARLLRVDEHLSVPVLLPDPGGLKRQAILASTDAAGLATLHALPSGAWTVRVDHPDHVARLIRGERTAARPTAPLQVVLEPALSIEGSVRVAPGQRPLQLRVRAVPSTSAPDPSPSTADVDPIDGRFTLRGLAGLDSTPAWRLSLVATNTGDARGAILGDGIEVRAGSKDVVLELPACAEFSVAARDEATEATLAPRRFVLERIRNGQAIALERRLASAPDSEGRSHGGPFALPPADCRWRLSIEVDGFLSEVFGELQPRAGTWDLGPVDFARRPSVSIEVVDAEVGAPVAGARIVLASAGSHVDDGGLRARRERRAESTTLAISDVSGRSIVPLPEGPGGRVVVHHPEFAPTELALSAWSSTDVVRVELARGSRLRVRVLDTDGTAAEGVGVDLRGSDLGGVDLLRELGLEPRSYEVTDPLGHAVFKGLPAGVYAARCYATPPGGGAGRNVSVDLDGVGDFDVVLHLDRRAVLSGLVTARGVPVGGIALQAVRLDAGFAGIDGTAATRVQPNARCTTGSSGEFAFETLPLGRYELRCAAAAGDVPSCTAVDLGPQGTHVGFELLGPSVRGDVVGPDGAPVAGACVRCVDASQLETSSFAPCGSGAQEAHSSTDGSFELDLPAGAAVHVLALRPGCRPALSDAVDTTLMDTPRLRLTSEPGCGLTVNLLRADGQPSNALAASEVRATYVGEGHDPFGVRHGWVATGGRARFEGLRPGTWRFEVIGFSGQVLEAGVRTLDLQAEDERTLDWTLP